MADCVNALKEWTGKTSAAVVFDSTNDEFTHDGLFNKVRGKENITVIGFTTDGDVFGGFSSRAETKQDKRFYDPTIFVFSFESHGRCVTPQPFVVKGWLKEKVCVRWENDWNGFVFFGVDFAGNFLLGNESSKSYCHSMSRGFEGLEDTTLTGENNTHERNPPYHHCTRFVAVLPA